MKRIAAIFAITLVAACGGVVGDGEGTDSEAGNDVEPHKDQVPPCSEPPVLEGVYEDKTIGTRCSNWIVNDRLTVQGTLTIMPGTTLTFSQGAELNLHSQGSLDAQGIEGLPIVFTGSEKKMGHWLGVKFSSSKSDKNRLSHVIIEYAGMERFQEPEGGLALAGTSTVVVNNSILRHNRRFGLVLTRDSLLPSFENNTLTDNGEEAALVEIASAGELTASNTYKGNGKERVRILAGILKSDTTLHALDVPFQSGNIRIENQGKLIVEPGTRVEFEADAELYTYIEGTVIAEGTKAKPIVFTGVEPTPGYWGGVTLNDNGPGNVLDWVTVEYGGAPRKVGNDPTANVELENKAPLRLSNSTLRKGAGFGLNVDRFSAGVTDFTGNTLTDNANGPVRIRIDKVHQLLASNTYSGNADSKDFVLVEGKQMKEVVAWEALDVPYLFPADQSGTLNVLRVLPDAHLTVKPGATLRFGYNIHMEVKGKLTAVGNGNARVTFTSLGGTDQWGGAAKWGGIFFNQARGENKLEFATVSDTDANTFDPIWMEGASVAVYKSNVSVANSVFRDNQGHGIAIKDSTVPGCGSAVFENNVEGDIAGAACAD